MTPDLGSHADTTDYPNTRAENKKMRQKQRCSLAKRFNRRHMEEKAPNGKILSLRVGGGLKRKFKKHPHLKAPSSSATVAIWESAQCLFTCSALLLTLTEISAMSVERFPNICGTSAKGVGAASVSPPVVYLSSE